MAWRPAVSGSCCGGKIVDRGACPIVAANGARVSASADGVISSKGSTNFSHPGWKNFDFRGALEARLGKPVVYNNDGNAAALYAS